MHRKIRLDHVESVLNVCSPSYMELEALRQRANSSTSKCAEPLFNGPMVSSFIYEQEELTVSHSRQILQINGLLHMHLQPIHHLTTLVPQRRLLRLP